MITLSFQGSDDRVVAWLRTMGPKITEALFIEMQRQMITLRDYVVADKLSGQVLRTKTGTLRRSQLFSVTKNAAEIVGIVATDPAASSYGRVHEYGGTYGVREYMRKSISGSFPVRAHNATYPERSFLRSALRDRSEPIVVALQAAIDKALKV